MWDFAQKYHQPNFYKWSELDSPGFLDQEKKVGGLLSTQASKKLHNWFYYNQNARSIRPWALIGYNFQQENHLFWIFVVANQATYTLDQNFWSFCWFKLSNG